MTKYLYNSTGTIKCVVKSNPSPSEAFETYRWKQPLNGKDIEIYL